jgi:branched-chain amino acid transport system substrate-binding protein
MKLPIIAGATSYDESVLQAVGDLADGVKSPSLYSAAIKTPQNKKFVSLYTTTYGTDPSHYSEGGYATGMWIKKTIEAVHGNLDDKEKVLIAMRKVQLPDAPRGPIKLDDYGNPIENVYLRKVEKINGKVQNTVIYTFPQVSQFWKYSPEEYMAEPPYSKDYPPCLHCLTH